MSRSATQSICAICRSSHRLTPSSSRLTLTPTLYRSLTTTPPLAKRPAPSKRRSHDAPSSFGWNPKKARAPPRLSSNDYGITAPPSELAIVKALLRRIPEWADSARTTEKLAAYGITDKVLAESMGMWRKGVEDSFGGAQSAEAASKALEAGGWDIARLRDGLQSEQWVAVIEGSILRNFLESIISHPTPSISSATITHLQAILSLTDLTQLPFTSHLPARSLSRHFHLHVGPTNSGKTYSALKALALAGTGAYAGPLRLLAHEVWERLNLGTVGGLDGVGRACNLITGEERRIVDEDSGLISCTVEMLPTTTISGDSFDVVVIDEIQMMGDTQRGGSWTNAVLSVRAKEVHLCGDDTTVELLSKLIPTLGDQMTIHRYERLTPLEVSEESLDGDYKNVQPGDCIVTFSRTSIFAVKKMVEGVAGRKCAVVYGALPPETRAEQAREFNEGRAEVLVASDAVGMGLNL